jgi:hypothetical protein
MGTNKNGDRGGGKDRVWEWVGCGGGGGEMRTHNRREKTGDERMEGQRFHDTAAIGRAHAVDDARVPYQRYLRMKYTAAQKQALDAPSTLCTSTLSWFSSASSMVPARKENAPINQ